MPNTQLARSLLVLALGLTVLVLGIALWRWQAETPQQIVSGGTSSSGTALIGGPFELVDQTGQTRTSADFLGGPMLIYFGYTYCPDICPTSLLAMTQGLELLEERAPAIAEPVVPLFITVDPERDTVETMKAYAEHFHARTVALTGSAEQVASAAKAYRVYYRKAESDSAEDYLMDHSGFIYLMDAEGAYLGHFSHNATAEVIAEKLAELLGS